MMHFPPVSDFPSVFEKNSDSAENFHNFTFSRKMSRFSYAKISDDLYFFLFSHRPQQISNFPSLISNFPLFPSASVPFPLFSETFYFPFYFYKFSPTFEKFTCFYMLCVHFVSPLL